MALMGSFSSLTGVSDLNGAFPSDCLPLEIHWKNSPLRKETLRGSRDMQFQEVQEHIGKPSPEAILIETPGLGGQPRKLKTGC